MPRLRPNLPRETEIIKPYIGKALVFWEGTTEYNYLDYFVKVFKVNENNKYTNINIEVEIENVHGNAQTVFNYAEEFLASDENMKKYKDYDKSLIFDCDDPDNIEKVIEDMINSPNHYILLLSNLLFETWLLMHFETVDEPLTKAQIYRKMAGHLNCQDYNSKEKAKTGNIRAIAGDIKDVKAAIQNAKNLEREYRGKSNDLINNIRTLNPYTKVYSFIEDILREIDNINNN